MGIPNCLTIAIISYKSYFQYPYAGAPLTECINVKALSLATNIPTVTLNLFLVVPVVNVFGLILCKPKSIDERS